MGLKVRGCFSEDYKICELDPTVTTVVEPFCPCDSSPLSTVCTLVGRDGQQRIRVGCCSSCGYIGYIDRVTKEWLIRYNAEIYDSPEKIEIAEEVRSRNRPLTYRELRKADNAVQLMHNIAVDKKKPVCEIGAGYGDTLKRFSELGFAAVIGVENSKHRARIASRAYHLPVLESAFEDETAQSYLKTIAPVGLFYSHHVLEHTYDPGEILSLAAHLQEENGYHLSVLPNFFGEPSGTTLFNLAHQHLFNPVAFERLLNRNGYEVVDDTMTTPKVLKVAARKTAHPILKHAAEDVDYVRGVTQKFAAALKLWENPQKKQRSVFERLYSAVNRERQIYRSYTLGAMHRWMEIHVRRKKVSALAVVVDEAPRRYTDPSASPIEVQFEGNVRMFY